MLRGRVALFGAFGLACAVLTGCGSGGWHFTVPSPTISNLRVRPLDPERVGRPVRYEFVVHLLFLQEREGTCEAVTSLGTVSTALQDTATADVRCVFSFTVRAPTEIAGTVAVVGSRGERSNALPFTLRISRRG